MLVGDEAALYEQAGRSGLDVSDWALAEAWSEVRRGDKGDVSWLLATYDVGSKDRVVLQRKGLGGLRDLAEHLDAALVQFGAFAVSAVKGGSRVRKLVCLTWVGEEVRGMARARVAIHRQAVDNFFAGTVASLSLEGEEDLADVEALRTRVAEAAQLTDVALGGDEPESVSAESEHGGAGETVLPPWLLDELAPVPPSWLSLEGREKAEDEEATEDQIADALQLRCACLGADAQELDGLPGHVRRAVFGLLNEDSDRRDVVKLLLSPPPPTLGADNKDTEDQTGPLAPHEPSVIIPLALAYALRARLADPVWASAFVKRSGVDVLCKALDATMELPRPQAFVKTRAALIAALTKVVDHVLQPTQDTQVLDDAAAPMPVPATSSTPPPQDLHDATANEAHHKAPHSSPATAGDRAALMAALGKKQGPPVHDERGGHVCSDALVAELGKRQSRVEPTSAPVSDGGRAALMAALGKKDVRKRSTEGFAPADLGEAGDFSRPMMMREHPVFAKYYKLLAAGAPLGAAMHRFAIDHPTLDESILESAPDAFAPDDPPLARARPATRKSKAGADGLSDTSGDANRTRADETLRRLFWEPLPQTSGTVFAMIAPKAQQIQEEGMTAMEKRLRDAVQATFTVVVEKRGLTEAERLGKQVGAIGGVLKKGSLTFIADPRRFNNIAIKLKQLRLSHDEIRRRVIVVDEAWLTPARVEALLACAPTGEDLESIEPYDGDPEMLATCEHFFFTVQHVPFFSRRLQALQARQVVVDALSEAAGLLGSLSMALAELAVCKPLVRLLGVVLQVGNLLNAGTARGDQTSFSLRILPRMAHVKSGDQKTNLLRFLVSFVEQELPETVAWWRRLPHLGPARQVNLDRLQVLLALCQRQMQVIRMVVTPVKRKPKYPNNDGDRFVSFMEPFLKQAELDTSMLARRLGAVKASFERMTKFFGLAADTSAQEEKLVLEAAKASAPSAPESTKTPPLAGGAVPTAQEFFNVVLEFAVAWRTAEAINVDKMAKAKHKEALAAAKAALRNKRKARVLASPVYPCVLAFLGVRSGPAHRWGTAEGQVPVGQAARSRGRDSTTAAGRRKEQGSSAGRREMERMVAERRKKRRLAGECGSASRAQAASGGESEFRRSQAVELRDLRASVSDGGSFIVAFAGGGNLPSPPQTRRVRSRARTGAAQFLLVNDPAVFVELDGLRVSSACTDAWTRLRDDTRASNWCLFSYSSSSCSNLVLRGEGHNGLAELRQRLPHGGVAFGGFRVLAVDGESRRAKLVFVLFCSDTAPTKARAMAARHKGMLTHALLSGIHVEFQVDNEAELSERVVACKLLSSGGAHAASRFEFGADATPPPGEISVITGPTCAVSAASEAPMDEPRALLQSSTVQGAYLSSNGWLRLRDDLVVSHKAMDAWTRVRDDRSDVDWCLLAYPDVQNLSILAVEAIGSGGLTALVGHLCAGGDGKEDHAVRFAGFRVTARDGNSLRSKFVTVFLAGEHAPIRAKAVAAQHKGDVDGGVFRGAHVGFQVTRISELSSSAVVSKLVASGGAHAANDFIF